jgi:hypothetical protein
MSKYKEKVREAIYLRESEGKAIYEVAELVEKIIRDEVAEEIMDEMDDTDTGWAYKSAANIARGREL